MDEETRAAVERLRDFGDRLIPLKVDLGTVLAALDRLAEIAPLLEIIERCEVAPDAIWSLQLAHRVDGDYRALMERTALDGSGHVVYTARMSNTLADAIAQLSAALAETETLDG